MPVLSAALFCFALVVALSVMAFAIRERALLSKEVTTVVAGLLRRTETRVESRPSDAVETTSDLEQLLNEVVQVESQKLAVLAVNELGGRAGLRRSRAILLSRGLPRIALLSGGGAAFVIAALGHFSRPSLMLAAASALSGLVCSFVCLGLNSATRRLAKKYVGIVDVLSREVEAHFRREVVSTRRFDG